MLKICCVYCLLVSAIFLPACGQEKIVTKTVIQTQYSTVFVPFLRYTTIYAPITAPAPDVPAVVPILTDATNTIALLELEPRENWRTLDAVNFSTYFQFKNLSDQRVNFGFTISGNDSDGVTIFTRSLNSALDGFQTGPLTVSHGEPLTIAQYDSITSWVVTDLITY